MTGIWINDDGLEVRFGREAPGTKRGGLNPAVTPEAEYVLELNWQDLASEALGTVHFFNNDIDLPDGFVVKSATVSSYGEDFAGGGVYDIGLYERDFTTAIDADGFGVDVSDANLNAAETALGGALIGTVLSGGGVIGITVATALPTAGKSLLTIRGYNS